MYEENEVCVYSRIFIFLVRKRMKFCYLYNMVEIRDYFVKWSKVGIKDWVCFLCSIKIWFRRVIEIVVNRSWVCFGFVRDLLVFSDKVIFFCIVVYFLEVKCIIISFYLLMWKGFKK